MCEKEESRPERRHCKAENKDGESWRFKQVKQTREGELSWHLDMEAGK